MWVRKNNGCANTSGKYLEEDFSVTSVATLFKKHK